MHSTDLKTWGRNQIEVRSTSQKVDTWASINSRVCVGRERVLSERGEAREDNFATLGRETKIWYSNGQWLLDRVFGIFFGW